MLATAPAARGTDAFLPEAATTALAIATLERGEPGGPLPIEARLIPDLRDPERGVLVVVAQLPDPEVPTTSAIRISVVFDRSEEAPLLQAVEAASGVARSGCWQAQVQLLLPDDLREVAVVVETGGAWGAAAAIESEPEPPPRDCRLARFDLSGDAEVEPPARPPTPTQVVRILPVASPARGTVRVRTLVTTDAVDKVVFSVDGEPAGESRRAPHSVRLQLGDEVLPHRIRAEAFTADGASLGRDELVVNASAGDAGLAVAITHVDPAGFVGVEATLRVPPGKTLREVELYWQEELAATVSSPPFRAQLAAPGLGTPDAYVRAVARFDDGTWVEAVALPGQGETIEVNLVEIYAVVTDREGRPVPDLRAEDFTVRLGRGARFPVERFGAAENLPLSLGLIVDTSESMWTLMPDTQRAASMFLGRMLGVEDRAFLVDFDTQPRLAHPSTSDLASLMRQLARLTADGATAMFDAVAFSALQFDASLGRRALVLLTDGDDYRSKLSLRRAVATARESGAPIYVIGLSGFDDFRRDLKILDIESLAHGTGGRVFEVGSVEELRAAYQQIETELRHQYVIAFSTPERLDEEQLRNLSVDVDRKGVEVRVAVNPLRP